MKSRLHPSKRKLAAWLESGEPTDVDEHVMNCDRCAETLEAIAVPAPELNVALASVLVPPDDLVNRMNDRISTSLRNRADLRMFAELVGVSVPTARLLLTDGPADNSTS